MDDDTTPIETAEIPEAEAAPRPGIWRGRSWFERARIAFGLLVVVTLAINVANLVTGPFILLAMPLVLAVGACWVWSLRSERAREAFLPFEAGAFVLAVALVAGLATEAFGDSLSDGDHTYIGLVGGAITATVVAFLRPIVRGRRYERVALGAIVGVAALVAALLYPTFDYIDGSNMIQYDGTVQASRNLAARYTEDGGIRLNDPFAVAQIEPLGSGYTQACPVELCGTAVAVTDFDEHGATSAAMLIEEGEAVPAPIEGIPGIPQAPSPQSNVSLELAPNGDTRLRIASAIARGAGPKIRAEVREGDCAAISGTTIDSWSLTPAQLESDSDIMLKVDVDPADLSLDDQLSVVVGIDKPLGTVRCATLISASGIILAKEGADEFGRECVAPLRLPDGDRIRLTPSSFQDRRCARGFSHLSAIASGTILREDAYRRYMECMNAAQVPAPDAARLTDGQVAIPNPTFNDGRDFDQHVQCLPPGTVAPGVGYAGSASGFAMDPATGQPVTGVADPAAVVPATVGP